MSNNKESYIIHLECTNCGKQFDANQLNNLCTSCGKVLYPRYDLEKVKEILTKDSIQCRKKYNIWRLHEIMPVEQPEFRITLGEGWTPIIPVSNFGKSLNLKNLCIKDEGQNPTLFENRSLPILVLSDEEDTTEEWPFPSFSGNLVGLSQGEETTLEHDFPQDSKYEALQGVDANFVVHVDNVRSRTLPDLDDEFAKSIGEYETVDDMLSEIRSDLEEQERRRYNSEYDNQVLDEIVEMSTFEYPPQMLEREIDNVIQRMEVDLQQQNLDIDLYLKTQQLDMDGLREEVTPVAVTRIQKSLTLIEISEAEGITVENEELQAETTRTLEQYSQYFSEQDFKNMLRDDSRRNDLVGNIMMDMLTSRTYERIRSIARGIEIDENGSDEEDVDSGTSSPDPEDTPVDVDLKSDVEGSDNIQGEDDIEVEEILDTSNDSRTDTQLAEEKIPEEELDD